MSVAMLAMIGFYVYSGVVLDKDLPAGFVTTTVLIMTGIILNALFLGIIGAYLGRIYQQVKRRPITIIEQRIDPRQQRSLSTAAHPDHEIGDTSHPGRKTGSEPSDGGIEPAD